MVRSIGILLALVLTGAAMPAAFSYQEDQGPVSQDRDKFSFNGYSNQTQFSFGGYSNQTLPFNGLNQTNRGQEISYLVHEINYLRQELLNLIKEKQKSDNKTKLYEQPNMTRPDLFANKTLVPNPAHEIMPGKINPNTRGPHHGHG